MPDEDRIIIEQFNRLGGKWIKIATYLNNRSSIAIKNRYYSVLRKKLPTIESEMQDSTQIEEKKDSLIQNLD
jgi:hypothetical protein